MTDTKNRYPQIARAIVETPWAILPEKLGAILEFVQYRLDGGRFTPAELEARIGQAQPRSAQGGGTTSVAVIPILGTIVPRADLFSEMSGATSAEQIINSVTAAANDPSVSAIVLDVDSPGGMVSMIPEAAAAIAAARDQKPVVAVANTLAASAAYWLASQADEIVVSPSAMVGSIGVITAHMDNSGRLEQMGVAPTLISAGKFKSEGNPYEPLSEEAAADMQSVVDEYYAMFTSAVARGRGVPVDAVRSGFGEGRVVTASKAVTQRMADRTDTLENTIVRLLQEAGAQPASTSTGAHAEITPVSSTGLLVDQALAVRDAAVSLVARTGSLAETRRGSLSAAKRDALTDAHRELDRATSAVAEMLVASTPASEQALEQARLAQVRRRHLTRQGGTP